jgi:hypothetical protein
LDVYISGPGETLGTIISTIDADETPLTAQGAVCSEIMVAVVVETAPGIVTYSGTVAVVYSVTKITGGPVVGVDSRMSELDELWSTADTARALG